MKRSDQLKQQRAAKLEKWDALVEKVTGENRAFTEDENTEIEAFRNEVRTLDSQIEAQEDLEARKAEQAAAGSSVSDGAQKEKEKIRKRFSIGKMFRDSLAGDPLEGAEKEVNEIGIEENREAGVKMPKSNRARVHVPLSFLRASQQTVGQDSGDYGGELVQNQAPRVQAGLEPKLWIETLGANFTPGLSGGDIPMPVASSASFEWLAEGADITQQKKTFTGPVLSPKRAGASISISNQLLMQSGIRVDDRIRMMLARGWENAINSAAINGAGGTAPTGILNYTGVLAAADVAAAAATYAKVVELQGLIEDANAGDDSLAYLLHPKLKAALKQKKIDAGSGRMILEMDALDGYKFVSTSLVPVGDDGGTPVYPLIYGNFSAMEIGQWGAVTFMLDPYSEGLADSLRIVVNTYADVQIANPKSFAHNSFLTNA